jgi:transposase InsO family protein
VFWKSPNTQSTSEEERMNIHRFARTTPLSRGLIADRRRAGLPVQAIAGQFGVDPKTVRKWVSREARAGQQGLNDRSSRPHRRPTELAPEWRDAVVSLRWLRFTQSRIADALGLSKARVQRVCMAAGLERLSALDPPEPENRYVRSRPGELVHVDTKKLARFAQPGHRVTGDRQTQTRGLGWEFLHVAIDDATRLAYAEVLKDERGQTCAAFLRRAAAFFARHGIRRIKQFMSDNGSGYLSRAFAAALAKLDAKHIRTRPYTPRTNGKAERLIQTMSRSWAYGRSYDTSLERRSALPAWLVWYNRQRPHGSLEGRTPMDTLRMLNRDNVLKLHS